MWFQKMLHPGVGHGAGAYYGHVVIDICIRAGDCKRAMAWFEQLIASGAVPAPRTLVAILFALAAGNHGHEVEAFFERMRAAGYNMDSSCWQAMIEAIALLKNSKKIENWFQRMKEYGCEPNSACYTAVIRSSATKVWSAFFSEIRVPSSDFCVHWMGQPISSRDLEILGFHGGFF